MQEINDLSPEEKMIYYYELYKKAKECNREAEANHYLLLAKQYMQESQKQDA